MTTMIALIGEQPQPNFLPVLHYEPDNVVLVYTTTTSHTYDYLKVELEKKQITVHGRPTDPYNVPAITEDLNNVIAALPALSSQPPLFNLTGGTKTMSFAAYQVAAQHNAPVIYFQSEGGKSIIHRYTWQDQQLCYQQREQLTRYLSLHDVLNLHLGHDTWHEKGPTKDDGGYLFELAIAQALKGHGYEVLCGVKYHKNQMDIDVMIRYENQVGIIEAKTGETDPKTGEVKQVRDLKGVKQLGNHMRYLKATYIRQFLIMNSKPTEVQQTVCDLRNINIKIISMMHYRQRMQALIQEDVDTLLAEIDEVMKKETPES